MGSMEPINFERMVLEPIHLDKNQYFSNFLLSTIFGTHQYTSLLNLLFMIQTNFLQFYTLK